MKVTMRCDQDRYQLDKADELYVPWKRRDLIEEIHAQYPNKTILLDAPWDDEEVDREELEMYAALCRGGLKYRIRYDRTENIPYLRKVSYYPITSLYDLNIAISNGVKEFYIGTELLHDLNSLLHYKQEYGITFRLVVNSVSYCRNLTKDNSLILKDSYVLPQELDLIEEAIDYIEFKADNPKEEAAYYRIYCEEKYFGGNASMLIKEMPVDFAVRLIEPKPYRFNCKMFCLKGGGCNLCVNTIVLANPELYKNIIKGE